jgi:succinate dehydrogenase subunit C
VVEAAAPLFSVWMLPPRSTVPLIPVKRFRMRDTIPRCEMGHCKVAHRDGSFPELITVNPISPCGTTLRAVATRGAPRANSPMNAQANLAVAMGGVPRVRKSRWPAKLDFAQSASGLILGLFMWGHMFFVSSILISQDAMWTITKFFEGYFFFGKAYPILVSFVVAGVFFLFIVHAALALRKFPINYGQYRAYRDHMGMMRHEDTTLWYWQVMTGFAMFFLASVHLYQMMMHPEAIGPWQSGDRVWSGLWWPLYLVLLFAVELHGGIGLYRLSVKWGWFEGKDPKATRKNLKMIKWALSAFFIVLGLFTLAAYIKIGMGRDARIGKEFVPSWQRSSLPAQPSAAPAITPPAAPATEGSK